MKLALLEMSCYKKSIKETVIIKGGENNTETLDNKDNCFNHNVMN